MDVDALAAQITRDRRAGLTPFLVVATGGTTNAGIVDPITAIAELAVREGLWFHVDAAWGGAAALVPELRPLLDGIERADSITFDAHKWFSSPMGAGLYLTRHREILGRTFRTTTDYMPRDAVGLDIVEPYAHSIQWSRRFIGLKVFLALAVAGWEGYQKVIRHQVALGDQLRRELGAHQWEVVNKTNLPVSCFVDQEYAKGSKAPYLEAVANYVVSSGKAWISTTHLDPNTPVLRACISNCRTEEKDIVVLIEALEEARREIRLKNPRTDTNRSKRN
jgi:glutamate/tyrosine decarboxylase-like PLP-dependent enzyme